MNVGETTTCSSNCCNYCHGQQLMQLMKCSTATGKLKTDFPNMKIICILNISGLWDACVIRLQEWLPVLQPIFVFSPVFSFYIPCFRAKS